MGKRKRWTDESIIGRAEFVERTVKEMCELLQADAAYREVSERIERAQGALQSIRMTLWQRELVGTVRDRNQDAA